MSNLLAGTTPIELAYQRAPRQAYATDDYSRGMSRMHKRVAFEHAHVQLNPGKHCSVLLFDIDRRGGAFAWDEANLPPPSWATTNPESGRAHLGYVLEKSVLRLDDHCKPVKLLYAVKKTMEVLLRADRGYPGLITKNPLYPRWIVQRTNAVYTLSEMVEWLPDMKPGRPMPEPVTGVEVSDGVAIFEAVRHYAYANWHAIVNEVRSNGQSQLLRRFVAIQGAKASQSMASQIERWLISKFDPDRCTHSSDRQRLRQRRAAQKRRGRTEEAVKAAVDTLKASGELVTQAAVVAIAGVDRSTISKHYRQLLS